MAGEPQALLTFPGIEKYESASVTMNHGITPAAFQISIHPQDAQISKIGPLTLTYAGTKITLIDCLCDSGDYQYNEEGQIIGLTIFDRRWRWRFGHTEGRFNIRSDNGRIIKNKKSLKGTIIDNTEKSPQDIATQFLRDMGESNYDISALPNSARPLFESDDDLPARALQSLCDYFALRIGLRLDGSNSLKLYVEGEGAELDKSIPFEYLNTTVKPATKPKSIIILCGHDRYQDDLDLIQVGLDVDGSIKKLVDLSYWPKNFNPANNPIDIICTAIFNDNQKVPDALRCAQESVGKWYQLADPVTIDQAVFPEQPALNQILPIDSKQIDEQDVLGIPEELEAQVYGVWWSGQQTVANGNNTKEKLKDVKKGLTGNDLAPYLVPIGFSIIEKFGLVKFDHPITMGKNEGDQVVQVLADLRLRCSFSIRSKNTGCFFRTTRTRDVDPSSGTQPRYVRHDELILTVVNFGGGKIGANLQDLDAQSNYYLDSLQKEYHDDIAETAGYIGIWPVETDGAIQSVNWKFSENDGGTTIVTRNDDPGTPTIEPYALRQAAVQNKQAVVHLKPMISPSQLNRILKRGR